MCTKDKEKIIEESLVLLRIVGESACISFGIGGLEKVLFPL